MAREGKCKRLAIKWLVVSEGDGPFLQARGTGGDCGVGVARVGLRMGQRRTIVEQGKCPREAAQGEMGVRWWRGCFNGS